jgi:hypothetical protein
MIEVFFGTISAFVKLLRLEDRRRKTKFSVDIPCSNIMADHDVASLPELTDMLLLPLPLSMLVVAVAVGMLKSLPSASFKEYVPLGDKAFFLGDVMEVAVSLGEFAFLGDRLGERLGETSPNGDRTGDFDLIGLRFGDDEVKDFDIFFGERLFDDLPRMGDKIPLLLRPRAAFMSQPFALLGGTVASLATLLSNECSNEARIGVQLSSKVKSSAEASSNPLEDEEEMCDKLSELERPP